MTGWLVVGNIAIESDCALWGPGERDSWLTSGMTEAGESIRILALAGLPVIGVPGGESQVSVVTFAISIESFRAD